MEYISNNVNETKTFAADFARRLKLGDTVAFYGDLGAGKTQFVAGAAAALGYDGLVTSPTFNILSVYDTVPPIAHFDVYRIQDPAELENTGFFDYAGREYITFIEWAELIEEYLPKNTIRVTVDYLGEERRRITVSSFEEDIHAPRDFERKG